MEQATYNFFTDKIQKIISNNYEKNFNAFKNDNNNIETFINRYNLNIVLQHMNFNITEEEYHKILNTLSPQYEKEKIFTKKINFEKKISGFVDTLILAIITGGFIGILLLNIYSKIIENV